MQTMKPILINLSIILCIASHTMQAQFSTPHTLYSTPLADITNYKVVDYNNDGVNDIVANTGSPGGRYTYFLKGTENNFEIDQRIQFDQTITDMTFYDFDNDGDLDFHSRNFIYENINSVFIEKTELSGISLGDFAIYDIDKDGLPDIIPGISSFDNSLAYPYYKNNGNLDFTAKGDTGKSLGPSQIKIADLDNDGFDEIIRVFFGGTFVHTLVDTNKIENFEFNNFVDPGVVEVGDINGDGIPDIVNQNDNLIAAYIYNGEDFIPKYYTSNSSWNRLYLYDYNDDQILDIILYDKNYEFITYKNGQLTLEKPLTGSSQILPSSECEIFTQGGKQILMRADWNALLLFDLENDNLTDGSLILDDFTKTFSPVAKTNNNDDLNYAFIEGATLNILKINPNTHQKEIDHIILKSDVKSAQLVELENGTPVYLISYKNDNGIYILDAHQPTIDQINNPKFQLTNTPIIIANKVDKNLSCLVLDGLDILRMTYDSDYKVEYLRSMNNLPRRIMEVDLNHDGNDDILWISNFYILYSEKTSNGYGDFIELEIADENYFFGNINLFDIDKDGEIEIVSARHSEVKVWDLDSNFGFEETSYEVENASFIHLIGNLDENKISLYRNNGHISVIYDFQEYLNSGNTDIDLMIDPLFGGSSFFRDLDSDGDLDIVIRNYYSLSVSLFGDLLTTLDQSSTLDVYPNPTNGYINFKSDEKVEILAIYDSSGNLTRKKFDLFGMPSGIYFIKVKNNNKINVVPIFKSE